MRVERIGNFTLYHADCRDVLPSVTVDHIITDPPFSARTHDGHNATAGLELVDKAPRAELGYSCLTEGCAKELADAFCKATEGWICWFTDHTLFPTIHKALTDNKRYVFAPLACTQPGRSVRLVGDGPSSWTDWMVVARTKRLHRWGTLPGAYVFPAEDRSGGSGRIGSKPLRMMIPIVRDYSKPGETVCDPCLGSGTTLVACARLGRSGVGIEVDSAAFDYACRRIEEAVRVAERHPLLFPIERPPAPVQETLW